MAIIYTYKVVPPTLEDTIVISDGADKNKTKQITIGDLKDLLESNFYDVFKQVCTPIGNVGTGGDAMPNNPGGVNWFYNNAALGKWTFTSTNPELKKSNLGNAASVNVQINIGAGTDTGNDIEWSLTLYQPGTPNYYQIIASTGEPGPNNIGQPIQSNGPTVGANAFTACNVQARISTIDIQTNFFDLYSETGELELWIRNQGTGGSIISSCGVSFYG